jgi:AhpD family alkylhydroperoxidase
VLVSETEQMVKAAGFVDIQLKPKKDYIDAMTDWSDPLYKKIIEHLPAGTKPGDYITSLEITAKAPSTLNCGASIYSPAVSELVAIGAAIAANCEPCFKYHYDQARKLGVSLDDMTNAVNTSNNVKQSPAKAILQLADRFLHGDFGAKPQSACCPGEPKKKSKCCS